MAGRFCGELDGLRLAGEMLVIMFAVNLWMIVALSF